MTVVIGDIWHSPLCCSLFTSGSKMNTDLKAAILARVFLGHPVPSREFISRLSIMDLEGYVEKICGPFVVTFNDWDMFVEQAICWKQRLGSEVEPSILKGLFDVE